MSPERALFLAEAYDGEAVALMELADSLQGTWTGAAARVLAKMKRIEALKYWVMVEFCPECDEPILGDGYDPGCSGGCYFSMPAEDCHPKYCSETCYVNAGERSDERRARGY